MTLEITFVWSHLWDKAWDWGGIATHLSIEEIASVIMAAILIYGKRHAKHRGFFHRFAHSYRLQFGFDVVCDIFIAILTIQVMGL